jgi:peptide/nickel transport system permease protein
MLNWGIKVIIKVLLTGVGVLHILYIINQFLPIDQAMLSLETRGVTKSAYPNYDDLYQLEKVKLGLADPPFYVGIDIRKDTKVPIPTFKWIGLQNRYHHFLVNVLTFDFGVSRTDGKSAMGKVFKSLSWTSVYVLLSIFFILILTRYFGSVLTQISKNKGKTNTINTFLIIFYSIPEFWIATLMVLFFSSNRYGIHLFSIASYGVSSNLVDILSRVWPMVLCSVIGSLAYFIFMYIENIKEENQKPYFRGALAKGLSKNDVIKIHTSPNAFFVMAGSIINSIPGWLGGSIILENIFNVPGLGRLLFFSFNSGDWQVLFAIIFLVSVMTTLGLAIGDLIHARYNPKTNQLLNI